MELSALLFSCILLTAGLWLIFMISSDFKKKRGQGQSVPDAARRISPAARHIPSGTSPRIAGSRQQSSTPPRVESPNASTADIGQALPVDRLQGLNVRVVRETFERFTREL